MADAEHGDSHAQGAAQPEFAFSPPPPTSGPAATAADTPTNPIRSSMTPGDLRAVKATSRRQMAAEWVAAQTGIAVPHHSDAAFRQSLADGVTLCRLMNALRPGAVGKILDGSRAECASPTGEVIQTFENVTNFIRAAAELVGSDSALSAADLEDAAERPQVADCLLALHAWQQQQQAAAAAEQHGAGRSASWPRGGGSSPAEASTPPPLAVPAAPASPGPADFSFTPHAASAVNRAGGQQRTDGLEYLMRTCNHMLKSSMGMPATPLPPPPRSGGGGLPPEIALDAVGPVLETVLQNLTAEYEKRLLAKDQEFKLSQEAQERMRRDIARLKQEVARWREEAAAVKYLPAPTTELSAAEREAYEQQLAARAAEAAAEVAAKEAELRRVQAAAAAHVAEADQKLEELSEEVQQYRHLDERYHSMAEENRQLYNTVQDLRGSIRVFCRVRPRGATGDGSAAMVELGEEGALNVFNSKHNKWHTFRFDKVFGEGSAQEAVYAETQPLIRSVLDGYNVCIFAYGQTGSGKTHTMSGTDIGQYSGRGINYRALDDLFELNRQRTAEVEYSISVQLLEIYNEAIRDLLVSDAEARQQRSLPLVNSQRSGFNVPDAIQVAVGGTEEVLEVMARGARNRAVAETKMNDRSSRSHQVLTVMVEGTHKVTHARTHGCLHLIDLAGSERVGKSGAEGQQLLEAQHINKSLSALGNVMHSLASKSAHIPFRDSKLTQLLQDSLSGQAKSMMFMHVAPEMSSVSETLSTLNFGKGVTEITLGAAKKNAESGAVFEAKERAMKSERDAAAASRALAAEQLRNADLQAELEALRAQLARAASSPCASSEDEGGTIRAYRPAATRQGGAAAAAAAAGGGGVTPRSRLSLPSVPAAAGAGGRVTPRGGAALAGSRVLTPRSNVSAGGITPRSGSVSMRPAQVSRLNLGGGGSGIKTADEKRLSMPGAGLRPPMARLNLQKLHLQQQRSGEAVEVQAQGQGQTPLSARVSTTPRSTNWLLGGGDDGGVASGSEAGSPSMGATELMPAGANVEMEEDEEEGAFQLAMSPPRLPAGIRAAAAAQQAAAASNGGRRLSGAPLPSRSQSGSERHNPLRASAAASQLQAPGSRIPVPSPSPTSLAAQQQHPSGSLTARPGLSKSPALSSIPRGPMSARESPAEAAARRAALQQKFGGGGGAGASDGSSLRRSVDGSATSRLHSSSATSLRRLPSEASEASSNGSLNSARGLRASTSQIATAGGRGRWA